MKKIMRLGLFAISAMTLFSCGTSRKLEQANTQIQTLNSQVESLNTQVAANNSTIDGLKAELHQNSKDMADCRIASEAANKQIEEFNETVDEQVAIMEQLMDKVAVSLEKFKHAGIDVSYNNGFIRISMPDHLVFNSGSTTVGWEGKQALKVVAEELQKYPNQKILVMGNTDNVPVKSKSKDNWSVSTERANAVVRVLKDDYGIDPTRLLSGGRAMYNPIGDNATEEGRLENRRTDIILNPDLSALMR